MVKKYFLIFIYVFSSVLYSQKNNEVHTLYIKFDQVLNLVDVEDVYKIEGFNKLNSKYTFTIKKGITLSKKKIDKLSRGNHSINNIFKIETQLGLDETQNLIIELKSLKNVVYCYKTIQTPNSLPPPPPHDISPTTPNYEARQGYIESDPGVNMRYAWNQGANGTGINIRDIEYGININHEDLNGGKVSIAEGMTVHSKVIDSWSAEHGTFTAGVVIADKGDYGVSGLAYNANEFVVFPEWTEENNYDRVLAVTNAIANSNAGDIIIYEMQVKGQYDNGPAELDLVIWDLTKAATDYGITIVAAAGNGRENLDGAYYSDYLNRGDSGAIIVGAGSSDVSHTPARYTSYGTRVNLQGWGSNVYTTGSGSGNDYLIIGEDDNQSYNTNFKGTSSATAIVGGCVAVLQSYYHGLNGDYLTSIELRDILVNTGIPQGGGVHIGPIPNMKTAMNAINQILDVKTYGQEKFYVTPNPASDFINIIFKENFSNNNIEVAIYNVLGQLVLSNNLITETSKIDIQELSNGIYILKLKIGTNQITKKIIVN